MRLNLPTILDPGQAKPFPRHPLLPFPAPMPDMALVAPPTSVWRDPNLMASPAPGITSMTISSLPLHHALNGGISPTTPQGRGQQTHCLVL